MYRVRRGEQFEKGVKTTADAHYDCRYHERGEPVTLHRIAGEARALLALADGDQHRAKRL